METKDFDLPPIKVIITLSTDDHARYVEAAEGKLDAWIRAALQEKYHPKIRTVAPSARPPIGERDSSHE